jgi:predicted transcriptional regulator
MRARAAGQTECLVLTEGRVLLGRVRDLEGHPEALVEAVMEAGPTTVRSDEPLEPLVGRLLMRDVAHVIVTTSDGVLVGLLDRAAAEAHLAAAKDRAEQDGPSCCD